MILKDFNTSNFLFDPKKKGFVESLLKYEEFNLKGITAYKKLLTYICLMCDKASDILNNRTLTYPQKKREAALLAGFELVDGRFPGKIEDLLVGTNKEFNLAYVKYLALQKDPLVMQLAVYDILSHRAYLNLLNEGTTKAIEVSKKITDEKAALEEEFFGGDEVPEMRRALYEIVGGRVLDIKPEDVVSRLEEGDDLSEFSPYEEGYKVDKLAFISDTKPDE